MAKSQFATSPNLEIFRNGSAILAQRGKITAENGNPERQRLYQRKPEPFCEGRKQKSLSSLEQKRRLGIGQIVAFEDDAAQRGAALQHVDRVFGFPTALSDQHETGYRIAEFVGEPAP